MGGVFKTGNVLTGPMPKGVAGTAFDPTTAVNKLRGDERKKKPMGRAATDLAGAPVTQAGAATTLTGG